MAINSKEAIRVIMKLCTLQIGKSICRTGTLSFCKCYFNEFISDAAVTSQCDWKHSSVFAWQHLFDLHQENSASARGAVQWIFICRHFLST